MTTGDVRPRCRNGILLSVSIKSLGFNWRQWKRALPTRRRHLNRPPKLRAIRRWWTDPMQPCIAPDHVTTNASRGADRERGEPIYRGNFPLSKCSIIQRETPRDGYTAEAAGGWSILTGPHPTWPVQTGNGMTGDIEFVGIRWQVEENRPHLHFLSFLESQKADRLYFTFRKPLKLCSFDFLSPEVWRVASEFD